MEKFSLKEIFNQSVAELKEQLTPLMLPRDYNRIHDVINEHLTNLLAGDNSFRNNLNASDAEYLNSSLRMALSFQKLTLANDIDFEKISKRKESDTKQDNIGKEDVLENTITLLPTIVCAFINPWLAFAVGGATVGYKFMRNGKKKPVNVKETTVDISEPLSENVIDDIVEEIGKVCGEIDAIIIKIHSDRATLDGKIKDVKDKCSLENRYPQILASLQYLFMENLKNAQKNPYVENILFSLKAYGYELAEYGQDSCGYFRKQIKVGIETATMYLPAIIKTNEQGLTYVVEEGVLFVPENKE